MSTYIPPIRPDELYHYGVKGMHWGVRRYQNPDGTLTDAGKRKYYKENFAQYRKDVYDARDSFKNTSGYKSSQKRIEKLNKLTEDTEGKMITQALKLDDEYNRTNKVSTKELDKYYLLQDTYAKVSQIRMDEVRRQEDTNIRHATNELLKKYSKEQFQILNYEGYYGNWKYDVPKQKRR